MISFIRHLFEFLATTYVGGIFWILFGIIVIRFTKKNPQKDIYSPLQGNAKGTLAGYGGIIMGIFIIILKLLNKV